MIYGFPPKNRWLASLQAVLLKTENHYLGAQTAARSPGTRKNQQFAGVLNQSGSNMNM
jgi:hypothetical protein